MTGVIATIPRMQFSNALGVPLAGGKLITYAAGTNTPEPTYQDRELTTANPTSITLDSTGSCVLWLDPEKSYKFVLKSALGVTQPGWPVDNISGASTPVSLAGILAQLPKSSVLAGPNGSSLIGYEHADGAAPTTVETALRRNLDDVNLYFIANEADSQPMFVRAMTARKRVWVPSGVYTFDSSLPIPTGCTLEGTGDSSELRFTIAGDGITSTYAINGSYAANITLHALKVSCMHVMNEGGGFAQLCGTYVDVRKVTFTGWKYGVIFDQTEIATISRCQFHGNRIGGIWLVNGNSRVPGAATLFTNRITVEHCQLNANKIGIIDDGGVAHEFRGNNINGGEYGYWIAGALTVTIDGGGEIEYCTVAGVHVTSVRYGDGSGVGQCFEVGIDKQFFIANPNRPCVSLVGGTNISLRLNEFQTAGGGSTACAVHGVASVPSLTTMDNRVQAEFVAMLDGFPSSRLTQNDSLVGNRLSKTQFYSGGTDIAGLETYCPSAAGGGTPISGIDLCANNGNGAKVAYARVRPAIYGNTPGAEVGGLHMEAVVAGTSTLLVSAVGGAFRPHPDNAMTLGAGPLRWSTIYAGTGAINTSDAREKQERRAIDAAALRAWAKVNYCQFKFNDAVTLKGAGARWHFGVIAQEVRAAFESEGLDAFAYGVLCYDEWPAQAEVRDADGKLLQPAIAAGNRYGIRYEEALALECAYLRSRIAGS